MTSTAGARRVGPERSRCGPDRPTWRRRRECRRARVAPSEDTVESRDAAVVRSTASISSRRYQSPAPSSTSRSLVFASTAAQREHRGSTCNVLLASYATPQVTHVRCRRIQRTCSSAAISARRCDRLGVCPAPNPRLIGMTDSQASITPGADPGVEPMECRLQSEAA